MFSSDLATLHNFQKGYSQEPVLLKNYGGSGSSSSRNNGFVSDIQQESVESRMKMFEKTASTNRASTYSSVLKGVMEESVYSQVFFSQDNVQILQNTMRATIRERTGYTIPPQSVEELMIIMRSIFLQYGQFYEQGITKEIERLNQYVLNFCIPQLQSSIQAYTFYLKEQANLPVPLGQPLQTDRDFKQLEMNRFL